jgi:hypothetical protein
LAEPEPRLSRGYARARERDAAARAELRPLAPGERPPALVIAAAVAALIAAGNLALMLAGWEVDGEDPPLAGALLFAGLMLAAAVGLWQRRYLAVVAFEALLGIGIVWAGLSLLVAANAAAVALCLAIMAGGGWLFWKLVRVMGRIQAGRRPGEPVG